MIISEYLDRYLDINPVGNSKINKKKYENNVDKDYPGLRKLIDTLSYYNEVIKYKRTYIFSESEESIIGYEDTDSEEDDNESNNCESESESDYNSDSDSD